MITLIYKTLKSVRRVKDRCVHRIIGITLFKNKDVVNAIFKNKNVVNAIFKNNNVVNAIAKNKSITPVTFIQHYF